MDTPVNQTIAWLLSSEPYIRYRTYLDLLNLPGNNPDVVQARAEMISRPLVRRLISDLDAWPGGVINNHKKADLLIHKLAFLAELGLTVHDDGIANIGRKITMRLSDQGIPEVLLHIPKAFGGTGEDMWAWTLCDTPRISGSLLKMGLDNPELANGIQSLAALCLDRGWPCACSPKMGRFKGPGRKTDPCPYATLLMLDALMQTGDIDSPQLRSGGECLLALWEHSRSEHPFLFHMGTDFRKLKAPFVWYDILHVADVLTRLPWLREDARLLEMLKVIRSKADDNGVYTPESVWLAWKEWDFGQKKQPSPWLTFLTLRVCKRVESAV